MSDTPKKTREQLAEERRAKLVITLNGKTADLNAVLPFTFRDLKKLKADGCDLVSMRNDMTLEHLFAIAKQACQKANSEITDDDVEDLPLPTMNLLASAAFSGEEETDRPT